MPAYLNKQKKKQNSMAIARQTHHKFRAASPLLIPVPKNIGSSTPEGSPEFLAINDLNNGEISDGMDLELWPNSPLDLEKDWDDSLNLAEEDEPGFVRERDLEELDEIYSDYEFSELEGEDLLKQMLEEGLKEREDEKRKPLTPYEKLLQPPSAEQWKKAERRRGLGYSGPPAERTVREHNQKAREAKRIAKEMREGLVSFICSKLGMGLTNIPDHLPNS